MIFGKVLIKSRCHRSISMDQIIQPPFVANEIVFNLGALVRLQMQKISLSL